MTHASRDQLFERGVLERFGVASLEQLIAAGYTRSYVRHRVASGRWKQVLPRAFLLHSGEASFKQTAGLVLAWAGRDALLSGPTAGQLAGLRGYGDERFHVLFPYGHERRAPTRMIRIHRTRRWTEIRRAGTLELSRVDDARAVLETAGLRSRPRDAVAVLAAAIQQRLVGPETLEESINGIGRLRHRAALLEALEDLAGGSHSLPEREFLQLCRRYRLPVPTRQAVRMQGARKRYLDAFWERFNVCVEIDGQMHMEVARWIDDLDRANRLATDGLLTLRFPAVLVRREPERVARSVRDALVSRGWDGSM